MRAGATGAGTWGYTVPRPRVTAILGLGTDGLLMGVLTIGELVVPRLCVSSKVTSYVVGAPHCRSNPGWAAMVLRSYARRV